MGLGLGLNGWLWWWVVGVWVIQWQRRRLGTCGGGPWASAGFWGFCWVLDMLFVGDSTSFWGGVVVVWKGEIDGGRDLGLGLVG